MEIQCPSCQKKLSIGDQFAGQLVKCPACNGVFMAPSLAMPAMPLAAPVAPVVAPPTVGPPTVPAAPLDTFGFSGEPPPRPEMAAAHASTYTPPLPPPPLPPKPIFEEEPPVPPGNFERSHTLRLSPDVLRWVAPAALSVVAISSFFRWVIVVLSLTPTTVVHLNLWEIAFGELGYAAWIMYLLFTLSLALPLAWVKLLMEMNLIPTPDALRPFWQWRSVAVGVVAALSFTFAAIGWLQLSAAESTSLGMFVGLRAHLVAIVACGLEFWLMHRKKTRLPLPEVTARW